MLPLILLLFPLESLLLLLLLFLPLLNLLFQLLLDLLFTSLLDNMLVYGLVLEFQQVTTTFLVDFLQLIVLPVIVHLLRRVDCRLLSH